RSILAICSWIERNSFMGSSDCSRPDAMIWFILFCCSGVRSTTRSAIMNGGGSTGPTAGGGGPGGKPCTPPALMGHEHPPPKDQHPKQQELFCDHSCRAFLAPSHFRHLRRTDAAKITEPFGPWSEESIEKGANRGIPKSGRFGTENLPRRAWLQQFRHAL